MPRLLADLEPRALFSFFEDICAIPHASGNEKALADYLVSFARSRGLSCHRDKADNVIIKKNASSGKENAPAVILQGHTDMVFVTDNKSSPDSPVKLVREGNILKARGTSLGADDGVAVAIMLALLDDNTLSHPALECVFTTREEVGLLGARELDFSLLSGKILINLDSDEEGIATNGCAGGMRLNAATAVLPINSTDPTFSLSVSGLTGGHSGTEIDSGMWNAHKILARVLKKLSDEAGISLGSLSGGTVDNAIPTESHGIFHCRQTEKLKEAFEKEKAILLKEAAGIEPNFVLELTPTSSEKAVCDADTNRILAFLFCCPNGVTERMTDREKSVLTSLNTAILKTENNIFSVEFSLRSADREAKYRLSEQLSVLARLCGFETECFGDYPGWNPIWNSPLQKIYSACHESLFGKPARCCPIHAGLECGIFAENIPGLDALSIGPTLKNIHSPKESIDLCSFARCYALTKEMLKML